MKKHFLALFLLIFSINLPLKAAQSTPSAIAWVTDGELWLAEEPLYTDVTYALFSPQGSQLAVVQNNATLIIRELATTAEIVFSAERFPADTVLGFLAWQGEGVLWFNTLQNRQNPNNPGDNLLQTDWALWVVNLATGDLNNVSNQGRGGAAFPSKDGNYVAWVYPGEYGEKVGVISLYHQAGDRLGEYEFTAVSSASHLAWLPEVHWLPDSILLALPDPDLVYSVEPPYPPTQLIKFNVTAAAQAMGEIQVPFPLELQWSPDGNQLAYISGQNLILHDMASGTDTTILEELPFGSSLVLWDQHLVINALEQGVIFWSEGATITHTETWSVAQAVGGGYVLLKEGKIIWWQADTETVLAEASPFETQLVQGIH